MQYLITQEELDNLVSKEDYENLKQAHEILWRHYCAVSNAMCKGDNMRDVRCDSCPIASLRLSKMTDMEIAARHDAVPYEIAKLVCPRNQHYSK